MLLFLSFLLIAVIAIAVVLGVQPVRTRLLTRPIYRMYRKILPQMSDTERDALEAGSVWWEAELFRGKPDWSRLMAVPRPRLTQEERDFLDNEVQTVCNMIDDWQITHELYDLPAQVWQYIRENRFL